MRIRKTVSFKEEIFKKIEKLRGQTPFSTYINEFFKNTPIKK